MKKLFRRRSSVGSESRSFPARAPVSPAIDGTHDEHRESLSPQPTFGQARLSRIQSLPESDTFSLNSVALSEAETLTRTRDQCLHFQDTYDENFTSYIPFLVRRQRAENSQSRATPDASNTHDSPLDIHPDPSSWSDVDSEDDKTMVAESTTPPIMQRSTSSYNHKRTMIVATELIRSTTYVFPNSESFELFKNLRSNGKKIRKNSIFLYDENSNIHSIQPGGSSNIVSSSNTGSPFQSVISGSSRNRDSLLNAPTTSRGGNRSIPQASTVASTSAQSQAHTTNRHGSPEHSSETKTYHILNLHGKNSLNSSKEKFPNCKVDSRSHIIPLDYKVKGKGLPLFKIVVPYMSTFRRKIPFMIFRKYIEKPNPPSGSDADNDEQFETYDFCTVHLKNSQHYKRYTFMFQPENGPAFTLLAFQNNYRPFTDFNYKGTRFRAFGTSISMAYLTHYNPELKLYILDKEQPSLMDNLIDKRSENDKSTREKKHKSPADDSTRASVRSSTLDDFQGLQNPSPNPNNPIIEQNIDGNNATFYTRTVPHEMPPFGVFLDACEYLTKTPLLPKKYSEVGKIDVYQDMAEMAVSDCSSSLSVDLDSLVLTTVFMALRETNIRTTVKHPGQAHTSRMGLLTAIALNGSTTGGQAALT
ncbi:hypothetical protein JCM33374_g2112 [Metschnikowia sp. JCM 33374]|nr:hypothetical protein JCM33374_g2112 [Metschnikowia sp. JCM 33374]